MHPFFFSRSFRYPLDFIFRSHLKENNRMTETIGVIGAGTMGNGIAQTAANAGFNVVMCDVKPDLVDRAVANISKSLDRFVKKETLTEEQKAQILGRITTTTELEKLKDCSLIVEAATENFDIKRQIFEKLDSLA